MAERQSTSPSIAICASVIHSEVVTNIALNVDYARLEGLMFSFELNTNASNIFSDCGWNCEWSFVFKPCAIVNILIDYKQPLKIGEKRCSQDMC